MKALTVACCLVLVPTAAEARESDPATVSAAARAFRAGQKAQLLGRYREAAEKYELADELMPTPEALRSALRMRMAAGDLVVAAAQADNLRSRCETPECRAYPTRILQELKPQLAQVSLECGPPCTVAIDGRPMLSDPAESHRFYLPPGPTRVDAIFPSGTVPLAVTATAGRRLELVAEPAVVLAAESRPPPPALPPPVPPRGLSGSTVLFEEASEAPGDERGLHPAVSLALFGVAAGLGAATVWSWSDTVSARDDYRAMPTAAGFEDGESRDLRTNALMYSAIGTAAVATLVAAIWTDW